MKKEIFIAVFVGLSMGLIITFGIYRVKTSVTTKPTTTIAEVSPIVATPETTLITVHSPEDGSITSESTITVAGTTLPNAYVVLFVNDLDQISTSDESGHFSFTAELSDGANILRTHVLNELAEVTTVERLVVVSSVFETSTESEDNATPSATTPEATSASKLTAETELTSESESSSSSTVQSIKNLIKKSLEESKIKGVTNEASGDKKALIGEVVRVTDDTVTISRLGSSYILPISSSVVITKDGKPVKLSDIAIENWLTVLGTAGETELVPEYVMVSAETLLPPTQIVTTATITKLGTTSMTILPRTANAGEKEIKLIKSTVYQDFEGKLAKLSNFSEDLAILITATETKDGITAATVRSLAEFE